MKPTTPEAPRTELQEVSAKLRSLYAKRQFGKLSKEHTELMERLEKRFQVLMEIEANGVHIVNPEAFEEGRGDDCRRHDRRS